jgi:predicted phosphoribosyltransferase/dienelactone hydrolase
MVFRDRRQAGRRLGAALEHLQAESPVVLGLPRGGLPVAAEVAQVLEAPLDVLLVRKLGLPSQPELAMGAVGEDGIRVLNVQVLQGERVSKHELDRVEARERDTIRRRAVAYRSGRPAVPLAGRAVVIVDDGIATGSTATAAIAVARAKGARRVVVAAPVAAASTARLLEDSADEVVLLERPEPFWAVGPWYEDFTPTTDAEVVALLDRAQVLDAGLLAAPTEMGVEEIAVGPESLPATLTVPADARGLVLFAHGSGSSRHSTRNRHVAALLHDAGIATLLFDLLRADEDRTREHVFDIPLLARRLAGATASVRRRPELQKLPLGYFGASTGAGAALWAAAEPRCPVRAVVSRGGRPDLAMARLPAVDAPTLLIVGGEDHAVLRLNLQAADALRCPHRVEVVPGASHLFEERGTLETAALLAAGWFVHYLGPIAGAERSEAS